MLDFLPLDEFRATQIYKEFSGPQGYLDFIQAVLEKSATSYAAATVILGEEHGPVSKTSRHRMQLLAPHFLRAVQIGKVIDLKEVKASALADALDGIAAAMFLLDGAGSIVHANVAGHELVAAKAVFAIDRKQARAFSIRRAAVRCTTCWLVSMREILRSAEEEPRCR